MHCYTVCSTFAVELYFWIVYRFYHLTALSVKQSLNSLIEKLRIFVRSHILAPEHFHGNLLFAKLKLRLWLAFANLTEGPRTNLNLRPKA